MASGKSRMLSKLSRILAEEADVHPTPRPETDVPYRALSGFKPEWAQPRVPRAYLRKPGRPKCPEPLERFLFNMTRREKRRWQRAAADLGIPLSMMIRVAVRYFMGSNRMQRIIKAGPREVEFRKIVRPVRMTARMSKVIGPDDIETREHVILSRNEPPRGRPEAAPPVTTPRLRLRIVPKKPTP